MSIFELFENARRKNAEFLTANPAEHLSDEELSKLAAQAGITVDELRRQLTTPNVLMTCALCGQPTTHLIGCRGCGGDAWAGELVMAEGDDVHDRLRAGFKAALTHPERLARLKHDLASDNSQPITLFTPEQIQHGAKHAYSWGGCMICTECWHHTLPVNAYQTCPLKLLADRLLSPNILPWALEMSLWAKNDAQQKEAIRTWLTNTWDHWLHHWNTLPTNAQRRAVAAWRRLLLEAAWSPRNESQEVQP